MTAAGPLVYTGATDDPFMAPAITPSGPAFTRHGSFKHLTITREFASVASHVERFESGFALTAESGEKHAGAANFDMELGAPWEHESRVHFGWECSILPSHRSFSQDLHNDLRRDADDAENGRRPPV